MATHGLQPLTDYWDLVLTAELASYAPLPWVRSRPPRALEGPGPATSQDPRTSSSQRLRTDGVRPCKVAESAPSLIRRFNMRVLDSASVQANTLPSGHVSGAMAAALAVMAVNATLGWGLIVVAGLIAVAAVAGRYHYAVDCVAGAAVAAAVWSLI
jgi:hypothetical protein